MIERLFIDMPDRIAGLPRNTGKTLSGRTIDGVIHDAFPLVAA